MARNSIGYDQDFYAWALHNARLIREGKFIEIDFEHVAEEIEDMGTGRKRELINRFAVLMAHLLKWQMQPTKRTNSWRYTIKEQRLEILDLLKESPSLNYEIENQLKRAYEKAIIIAAKEMSIDEEHLPGNCPFQYQNCLDHGFLPE